MVFYRKYRPQNIEELDSESVRDQLSAVLTPVKLHSPDFSIPHAFLLTGPKGLGKTSAARIIAKVVNCEKKDRVGIEPCNRCRQCVTTTKGTNLDVLEIDAASNRGIDEIRDLREKIRLSPLSSDKKIYIIDEVHMLTTEAFNALLKTIEEPPEHVVFVMCTTDPQKIPQTIVSRCFHIQFTKATDSEQVRSLKRIVKAEKIEASKDALFAIAKISDGSFRDAAKSLEELLQTAKGKKITKELVEAKYHTTSVFLHASSLINFLSERKQKDALAFVSQLSEQGVDMKYLIETLVDLFHTMLLTKAGVETAEDKEYEFSIEDIKLLITLLTKAHAELRYAVLPQLPIELVIIEFCLEKQASRSVSNHEPEDMKSETQKNSMPKSDTSSNLWRTFIDKIKLKNYSVAGVLRGCRLKSYDGKSLVIETDFKFHKERLSDQKALQLMEAVCKELSGNTVSVSVLLRET